MRLIAGVLAAALALAACSDSGEPVPLGDVLSPTPTPPASPVEASEPEDPYAVPDEITAEYVERVYAALAKLESEAIRAYRAHVENGGDPALPPKEAVDRFRAIYSEANFPSMMALWRESADEGFAGYRSDLDQAYLDVTEVVARSSTCVVVVGDLDLTGTASEATDLPPSYFGFVRGENTEPNSTPWELHFSYLVESHNVDREEPCAR